MRNQISLCYLLVLLGKASSRNFLPFSMPSQGVYNCLLLVPIVGGSCFQRHQLAAVFNVSFSIFQLTYEISRINRMGEEGNFCDAMSMYP